MSVPVIRKLDEKVVNRIAAGEVIQRPSSALKEMLENSLDAGATQITVTAKDGGLKVLQIQDNGHGIRVGDLPILCHRHTTSKLQAYEDLETINTLGFRGEALASISFVSHMTVTTMTADQQHGWKVAYKDSEVEPPGPKACAAVKGTTILVEDLFYNVPTRRKALKNTSEEYSRILDIMSRYAVYNAGVGFTCKRQGEARFDLHTLATGSRLDNIRTIFGAAVARELLPISIKVGQPVTADVPVDADASFELEGFVSSANHNGRKSVMVLFINGRSVECSPLKRAIEVVYTSILPKASKPFLFLDLKLPPRQVEVNVHPTKREVGFLHQDEIIESIREAVEKCLLASNHSRTFTQAQLPFAGLPEAPKGDKPSIGDANGSQSQSYYRPDKLVRTDHKSTSMDAFVVNHARAAAMSGSVARKRRADTAPLAILDNRSTQAAQPDTQPETPAGGRGVRQRKNPPLCELSSIRELVAEVDAKGHEGLTDILREHSFVGMADDTLALIQHQTRLYLVDAQRLSQDLFYQQALRRFSSPGCIQLQEPASIQELAEAGLTLLEAQGLWQETDGTKQEVSSLIAQLLQQKGEMLREYLSIGIDEQCCLTTLPLLIDGYCPDLMRLPELIIGLAQSVDWMEEKGCFRSLAEVLAAFYCIQPCLDTSEPSCSDPSTSANAGDLNPGSSLQPDMPKDDNNSSGLGQAAGGTTNDSAAGTKINGREGSRAAGEEGTSLDDLDGTELITFPESLDSPAETDVPAVAARGAGRLTNREWSIQHVVFPAMKMFLKPPCSRGNDGTVIQVASLEKLYRIFERC